jgi:hypothetical protein
MSCLSPMIALHTRARLAGEVEQARAEIADLVQRSRLETRQRRYDRRKELRTISSYSPLEWSESHDPTEAVVVRRDEVNPETGRRIVEKELCRRRRTDIRLWGEMTDEQVRAAEAIVHGFLAHGGKLGCPISRYGTEPDADPASAILNDAEMSARYRAWGIECRRQVCEPGAVIDVLAHGATMQHFERSVRARHGTGRGRLFEALDLYVEMGRGRHT